jgi:hypothetical protein
MFSHTESAQKKCEEQYLIVSNDYNELVFIHVNNQENDTSEMTVQSHHAIGGVEAGPFEGLSGLTRQERSVGLIAWSPWFSKVIETLESFIAIASSGGIRFRRILIRTTNGLLSDGPETYGQIIKVSQSEKHPVRALVWCEEVS